MTGLIIDSFAGGGGASLGIATALGRGPDVAINHDPEALAMHQANHPGAIHLTEDIWSVDPRQVTRGRPVDLMWASPDCTHHSRAKGGRPVEHGRRSLADALLPWAEQVRPRLLLLENVAEFADWGPLTDEGRPCPDRRGTLFARWVEALRRLGYEVDWRILRACDYGTPTSRARLFLVARCDGRPIVWPAPTHGDPESLPVRAGLLRPWRTAAECIDWSLPYRPVEGLAPATVARIEEGRRRYPGQPYLIRYYGKGGQWGSIDAPLHTIPTRDRFALVSETGMRMLSPAELFACQGFPADYDITTGPAGRRLSRAAQIRMCGNSVCPQVAAAVVRANVALSTPLPVVAA